MPRFVLLHHKTPAGASKPDHFDLMLQAGDVLKTWTLWNFPQLEKPNRAAADFDHRPAYLDYEGPVSRGRGEVTQADAGTFEWITREPNRVVVELQGRTLQGRLVLKVYSANG